MTEKTHQLGQDEDLIVCTDAEQNTAIITAMVQQCKHQVEIFSKDLEPLIYDNESLIEALENFALANHYAKIRILVQEPRVVAQRGHGLLRVGQRLSSFFEFRRPADMHLDISETFLIADGIGFVHRPYSDSLKAHANFCDPRGAKELSNIFRRVWEAGEADNNLRSLIL